MLTEEQAEQIEKIGVTLEKSEFPPLAARIMALLLVAEPPFCTFEEIMTGMGSSKSSVSTSVNLLLNAGLIDYVTFPRDRKRYFKVNKETWLKMIQRKVDQIEPFRGLLKDLARSRSNAYPEFNKMLSAISDLHGEIAEAVNEVLRRWEKKDQEK